MILIGQYDSPFVRRVGVVLNHYQMPFERKVLSVFSNFEEMLKLNPLGKVPVLELDDGETLFDSRIICDYLEGLVSTERQLVPRDDCELRQMLRIEAVAIGLAEKCYERGIEYARRDPDKVDPVWTERLRVQITSALAWLEAQTPNPFFLESGITRADISCAIAFTFLQHKQQIKLEPGPYPALEQHCRYCEGLPQFQAAQYSASEAAQSGWQPPD